MLPKERRAQLNSIKTIYKLISPSVVTASAAAAAHRISIAITLEILLFMTMMANSTEKWKT